MHIEKELFTIDSSNWETMKNDIWQEYKQNPEWDIREYDWYQYFTWGSAMRETQKVGKRIPTDEEFNQLKKEDFFNTFPGYRNTSGTFNLCGSFGFRWSSAENGCYARYRYLHSDSSTVGRDYNHKGNGFSVVCLED